MIFTCAQKAAESQLHLAHGAKQKSNEKTKIKNKYAKKNRPVKAVSV